MSTFRKLFRETLEARQLLAADWQNPLLRLDVDASQVVNQADVQALVQEMTSRGFRTLTGDTRPTNEPYCDVNGDEIMSPLDVLHIVNGLNRSQVEPMRLEAEVAAVSDRNQNGYVLGNTLILEGESRPNSIIRVNGDIAPLADVRTDAVGHFQLSIQLSNVPLDNSVQLVAIDEVGRTQNWSASVQSADIVQDWNATILNVVRDWTTTSNDPTPGRIVNSAPPMVARNMAMIHVAMFDAMNAVSGQFVSYHYSGQLQPTASPIAAAAAAAHRVASSLYSSPTEIPIWDATLAESLTVVTDTQARDLGIALGQSVGDAILALRANDGSTTSVVYTPQDEPGTWRRTLPGFLPPLLPQWPDLTPFAITRGDAFRPAAPPSLSSATYAASVDEVMRLGSATSTDRTADQTQIANFWADGGGTATPPGHWNRIASDIIAQENVSIIESARTMALLNLALADAGFVSWDAKYGYDLWRPVDAIRQADTDGNQQTDADTTWLPLLTTPPFPTYTSGHSTFSGAAAAVLTDLFGDNFAFSTTNDQRAGYQVSSGGSSLVTRQFTSFQNAADEAGMSRIYGGIHFDFDNTAGLSSGKSVGQYVTNNYLKAKSAS